jgi:hypothetical protein
VQLSSAIKDGLHGTVGADSPKSNLLRRASTLPIGELNDVISQESQIDCATLLPLIKQCVFVSEVGGPCSIAPLLLLFIRQITRT